MTSMIAARPPILLAAPPFDDNLYFRPTPVIPATQRLDYAQPHRHEQPSNVHHGHHFHRLQQESPLPTGKRFSCERILSPASFMDEDLDDAQNPQLAQSEQPRPKRFALAVTTASPLLSGPRSCPSSPGQMQRDSTLSPVNMSPRLAAPVTSCPTSPDSRRIPGWRPARRAASSSPGLGSSNHLVLSALPRAYKNRPRARSHGAAHALERHASNSASVAHRPRRRRMTNPHPCPDHTLSKTRTPCWFEEDDISPLTSALANKLTCASAPPSPTIHFYS
ncbi:uncharacterized protein MONBRDRAFT_11850 [Monosiga brevicollis MX1]|uniref:Uncharacterized protein n=1 Tax=Monosiga brevicollis TaxID=81824 RepID=A9VAG8_MONBE|nr:uncharacterized protein MONBRDRAFT_11850 [Monosiga brevicollis MX1]EDQ85538.1 predicted protein [Monosiga brevicollis MX1]|eukprot:XP_001749729.1 hypothetical protein [Monosiga brevicollis MX1]